MAVASLNFRHLASLEQPLKGKVTFQVGDFFSLVVPEEERFDVVYDYT